MADHEMLGAGGDGGEVREEPEWMAEYRGLQNERIAKLVRKRYLPYLVGGDPSEGLKTLCEWKSGDKRHTSEMVATLRAFAAKGACFPNSKFYAFQLWRWLCKWNEADAAEAMISTQPDLHIRNRAGNSPLHLAAAAKANNVVEALVSHGADVAAVNAAGSTPLLIAASLKDEGSLSALCEVADPTALMICNPQGYTPRTLFPRSVPLRNFHAPFNGVTTAGESALVCAVRVNEIDLVISLCKVLHDELSEEDAQKCLFDSLWLAVCMNLTECLRALLAVHRPDLFSLDAFLCLAAEKADVAVVEALLRHDESLTGTVEVNGVTASDFASKREDEEGPRIVELLAAAMTEASEDSSTSTSGGSLFIYESQSEAQLTVRTTTDTTATQTSAARAGDTASFTGCSGEVDTTAHVVRAVVREPTIQLTVRDVSGEQTVASQELLVQTRAEVLRIGELQGLGKQYIFAHFLPCGHAGQGSFGEVTHALFGRRRVVFKIEKRRFSGSTEMDCNRMMHFAREAKTLRVLQEPTHPNCVSFLGIAVDPDVGVAIVTEYVSGGSLGEWLCGRGVQATATTRLELAAGLVAGLVFVHETGIVHGDIKPDNILLEYEVDEGTGEPTGVLFPKIIDFGGACPFWKGRTAYTELYAPPEVRVGRPTVAQSDVYSLTCVVYEILSGQRVSQQRKENVMLTPVGLIVGDEARAAVEESLPAELKEVGVSRLLCECWKPEPQNRPRAVEVYDQLITFLHDMDTGLAAGVQNRASSGPDIGNSPLMAAVQFSDAVGVTTLLEWGLRPDEQNSFGHTPLHVAAAVGDVEVLRMLLSYNPQLLQDKFGASPPDLSANEVVSRVLLEYEEAHSACAAPATKTRNDAELYPIHDAIERGDLGRLTALVANGHSNSRDSRWRTVLEVAANSSSVEMFACVVDSVANDSTLMWMSALNAVWSLPRLLYVLLCRYLRVCPDARGVANGTTLQWLPSRCGGLNDTSIAFGWARLWKLSLFAASHATGDSMYDRLFSLVQSIDAVDDNEPTALMCAAHAGQLELVELLLDRGASVNETCGGMTALEHALDGGHSDVFHRLLKAGSAFKMKTKWGVSYLELSDRGGSQPLIEYVTQRVGVDAATSYGKTGLMFAAEIDAADVAAELLNGGANVHATTADGKTALMFAAERGNTTLVQALVDNGVNVHAATVDGKTSLMFAAENGEDGAVRLLVGCGANVHARAAEFVRTSSSTKRWYPGYRGGYDANVDVDSRTALMLAAENGGVRAVHALVDCGANVDAVTVDGKTALMLASGRGNSEVVQLLVGNGANVNATTADGKTALMLAEMGNSEVVQLLVGNGANVNATTADGKTVLMLAAEMGNSEVVQMLVGNGANVNAATADGKTALMLAAENGRGSSVRALVDCGANVDATTPDGMTALMLSVDSIDADETTADFGMYMPLYGRADVVSVLLKAGANTTAIAADGSTALSVATAKGHGGIVALLTKAQQQLENV